MTRKKERRKLAKEIRKATGVSLPVSVHLAKHGRSALYEGEGKTAEAAAASLHVVTCGYGTCQMGWYVEGPKGRYDF